MDHDPRPYQDQCNRWYGGLRYSRPYRRRHRFGLYVLLALLGLAIWLLVGCAAQTPLGGRYSFDPDPKQIEAFSRGAAKGAVQGLTGGSAPAAGILLERLRK